MPASVVESTIRTRLATAWDTANGFIFSADEMSAPPPDGSAFLLIQYPVVDGRRPVLTQRRLEEGVARIIYNVPRNFPIATTLPKAEIISALFRGDGLRVNGVEFLEPSNPIITDNLDDGNYYELAVMVPYRYQFNAA